MEVVVVSSDLQFVSAVQALAGAMGHNVRTTRGVAGDLAGELVVLDFGTLENTDGLDRCEVLRTVAFVPLSRPERMVAAQALGIRGVFARGALAVELPRLLGELAD